VRKIVFFSALPSSVFTQAPECDLVEAVDRGCQAGVQNLSHRGNLLYSRHLPFRIQRPVLFPLMIASISERRYRLDPRMRTTPISPSLAIRWTVNRDTLRSRAASAWVINRSSNAGTLPLRISSTLDRSPLEGFPVTTRSITFSLSLFMPRDLHLHPRFLQTRESASGYIRSPTPDSFLATSRSSACPSPIGTIEPP